MKLNKICIVALTGSLLLTSCSLDQQAIAKQNNLNQQSYIKADLQTRRIPVGTVMKLKMLTSINTYSSNNGDQFSAALLEDINVEGNLLLPAGTIIRGIVSEVKHTTLASISAQVVLTFDHVVTPVGKLVPVTAQVTNYDNMTIDGKLNTGVNYFSRMDNNFDGSVDMVSNATSYGNKIGEDHINGYSRILTVPLAATGGVIAGSANFVGRSVFDIFRKGEDVVIESGDVLNVSLNQPLDIPLN